jgi:23S rRNA U2552 (ribose-2'-O)-methylase RlmE/FtsJ
MWSDFFPKSTVYGVDVHPKTLRLGKRIKVFQGDQRDAAFLNDLVDKIGEVDIIIDDASHLNDHTIRTSSQRRRHLCH